MIMAAAAAVWCGAASAQVCPSLPEGTDPGAALDEILSDSDELIAAAENDTFGIRDRAREVADIVERNGYGARDAINDAFTRATGRAPSAESWRIALNALRNINLVPTIDPETAGETYEGEASRNPVIDIAVDAWAPLDPAGQADILIHEMMHALSYAEYGDGLSVELDHDIIDEALGRLNYEYSTGSCEPRPPSSASGSSHGDPHIRTLDGLAYSFQTIGEYVLTRGAGGFEVQTRQGRAGAQPVSLNTAVAMRIDGRRVAIYAQAFPGLDLRKSPVMIDGRAVKIAKRGRAIGRGRIIASGDGGYRITAPTGEIVEVERRASGDFAFLDVRVTAPGAPGGRYLGLLGDYDGDRSDDLRTRDGAVIAADGQSTYGDWIGVVGRRINAPAPLSAAARGFFDALHQRFGESWRVTQAESLFDYGAGQSIANYSQRDFPTRYLTTASFLPESVREAEAACRAQGVDIDFFEGCVFDVALTGDPGFARMALGRLEREARARVESEARRRIESEVRRRLPF